MLIKPISTPLKAIVVALPPWIVLVLAVLAAIGIGIGIGLISGLVGVLIWVFIEAIGDDGAGVMLTMFFTLCSLFFFYIGFPIIINRKMDDITGRWAVLIGTGFVVGGIFLLAMGILFFFI